MSQSENFLLGLLNSFKHSIELLKLILGAFPERLQNFIIKVDLIDIFQIQDRFQVWDSWDNIFQSQETHGSVEECFRVFSNVADIRVGFAGVVVGSNLE